MSMSIHRLHSQNYTQQSTQSKAAERALRNLSPRQELRRNKLHQWDKNYIRRQRFYELADVGRQAQFTSMSIPRLYS